MSAGFRNEQQRCAVVRCLLATVRLDRRLWDGDEWNAEGILARDGNACLSSGEHVIAQAAWAVWNGGGTFNLGRALDCLDGRRLLALGSLLVALGRSTAAIDAWIISWSSPQ